MSTGEDRFATMSLGSRGPATIPNRRRVAAARQSNHVGDIEGARPELKYLRYTARPDYYRIDDIEGAAPMKLHKKMSRCDDYYAPIEGSMPKRTLFRTSRLVDPLDPDYKLPSCKPAEPYVPRFIRDAYTVSDIDGTRPRSRFRFAQRETHECRDIEGAQTGWRPRNERVRREGAPLDMMNVRDINDLGFKTRRTTNPLRPVHYMNGMTITDDMDKTMPKKLPRAHAGPYFPLHTQDIEGAQCGWKPPHTCQPPLESRRHFRNINHIGDIEGAQPDTVKHAIRTNRKTNPLNPAYTSLDGGTLPDPTKPDLSHLLKHLTAAAPAAARSRDAATLRTASAPSSGPAHRRAATQHDADVAAVRALP